MFKVIPNEANHKNCKFCTTSSLLFNKVISLTIISIHMAARILTTSLSSSLFYFSLLERKKGERKRIVELKSLGSDCEESSLRFDGKTEFYN